MEKVILVDEFDNEVGTEEKMKAHTEGKRHRAISVFIFNDKKQLLLQKRKREKYHCGGLWTNTCCSHPRPGEETIDAAHRRLMEEMGFDCELREISVFNYRAKFENGLEENECDHVFVGKYSKNPKVDTKEVEDWKWIEIEELKNDISLNQQNYTFWFREILGQLKI